MCVGGGPDSGVARLKAYINRRTCLGCRVQRVKSKTARASAGGVGECPCGQGAWGFFHSMWAP